MTFQKINLKYILQVAICFLFFNTFFNVIGLWLPKLLKPHDFSKLDNVIREFIFPIGVQTAIFIVIFSITTLFTTKNRWHKMSFAVFITLALHILFFVPLHFKGGVHFISHQNSPVMYCLSYTGQYLVDVLYLYFPIEGNFENNIFAPLKTGTFYMHWIFLTSLYYFLLNFISCFSYQLVFDRNTKKQPIHNKENYIENEAAKGEVSN